jgi:rubredoxin
MGKLDLWICTICEYVYDPYIGDPDNGVDTGTSFLSLPHEWTCPICGAEKNEFVPYFEHAEYGVSEEIEA